MNYSLIRDWTDVSVLNLNVKTFLLGKSVKLVVDEVSIVHILLKTNNSKALKGLRFMDHLVETV